VGSSEARRECPPPEQAEQGVLGEVDELPPDELERPEPQLKARLGREVEDRRHEHEWGKPEVGAPKQRHMHTVESEALLVITTKSPYAVRALAELARRGGSAPVPIGEIARAREIPVQFLEGLFASLRRAGILQSQRGVKGGYTFARSPEDVTVLEVVELLEGELGTDAAASGPIWTEAVEAVRNVLGAATIATVAEREAQSAAAPMYYI
jgi:Rrf2 family transcriptional regulator, cysteine metabolism repressor